MDETRARFLAAIAKQLPAERIAEAHLFAAIRQGGVESGVAVIALEQEQVETPPPDEDQLPTEAPDALEAIAEADVNDALGEDTDDLPADADDDSPYADAEPVAVAAPAAPRRYVVCTARYRHTLKGPERGKWEVTVTEEADAPLLTVDAVVRGVQRRSGDVDETVRLSGDELRAALPVPATP
ncbi:MAG: hypothetical protein JF592_18945 [Microbacterium sp.]|uniref:hypothetical protein n=1 Tax=Microbacterium sp. TaxID=51671 RepID=UPI001D410BAA|nr:hypothetical protein [Microbacterium sp.]MBW8764626.1 hypothetical protein [Microbacterium sp.]